MSKMDRILNSKNDKESIYEIYRACRLCGGGAGYKMPIIQNIIDLDEADVELKLKIRECVQIEVHQDDKMPPLICELCVDKVNDFYEFLEMCRQTNKKTRFRLGLPPQSLPRGAPDAGDCILGLTEPVFVNQESEGALSKQKKQPKVVVKKEPVVRIKVENLQEERSSRQKKREREKTPPRVTRLGVKSKEDDMSLSNLKVQDKSKNKTSKPDPQSSKTTPRSILKKERGNSVKSNSSDDTSINRLKRSRDKEVAKLETPTKKAKVTIKPPPPPKQSPKTPPKRKPSPKPEPKPVRQKPTPVVTSPKKHPLTPNKDKLTCTVCGHNLKTTQAMTNHLKSHNAQFTSTKLACNPCGEWFNTPEEVSVHHRRHKYKNTPYNCRRCDSDFTTLDDYDLQSVHHRRHKYKNTPYNCRRCDTDFTTLDDYDLHIKDKDCIPLEEVPDVKCDACWRMFPTNYLFDEHHCLGEDNRPGGNCYKCNKSFAYLKTLKKHQSTCTGRKKDKLNISKKLLNKLKPMKVRIERCDSLLRDGTSCDVSFVSKYYGLDPNCFYPYISGLRIKSEFPGMVAIHDEIEEFFAEDYVHWDSDQNDDTDDEITCNDALNPSIKKRQVDTLTALALKTIFSPRLLGKVPRKKRKIKAEKVFDSLMADQDEVRFDINNIINNLGDDNDDESLSKVNDSNNDSVNDSDKYVSFNEDTSKNNDEFNDTTSVESVDILKDINNSFNESTDGNVNGSNKLDESREFELSQNENNDSAVQTPANDSNINDSNSNNNDSQESESLQNENNDSAEQNADNVNDSNAINNESHESKSLQNENNDSVNKSKTDSINKNDNAESKLESVSNKIISKINDTIESNTNSNNDSNSKDSVKTDSKIMNKDIDCTVSDKLDELLGSNAGSKVSLGINDFSFDC